MKKITALIICAILLFTAVGCDFNNIDKESKIYSSTVHKLLEALEDKDVNAVYNLFSPFVQDNCKNLKDKIKQLTSIYGESTEKIGDISCLAGDYYHSNGKVRKSARNTFPVFSDGKYYWLYLDLMYENTFDKSKVGITQLDFYTADSYCDVWSNESKLEEKSGLNIYSKTIDGYNVISINNYPYNYSPTEELSLEEVKSFFKSSTSMSEFTDRFGEAAASNRFGFGYIYSLPDEEGENRYLYVAFMGDSIIYCDVLSDFAYIQEVWKEKSSDN